MKIGLTTPGGEPEVLGCRVAGGRAGRLRVGVGARTPRAPREDEREPAHRPRRSRRSRRACPPTTCGSRSRWWRRRRRRSGSARTSTTSGCATRSSPRARSRHSTCSRVDGSSSASARAGWRRSGTRCSSTSPRAGAASTKSIEICRRLWSEDVVEHHGEFFDFQPVMFNPKPIQQPIPIVVGGDSPAAMRRTANVGDGWIPMNTRSTSAPAGRPREQDARRRRAARAPPRSRSAAARMSVDDFQRYRDAGVDRIICAPFASSARSPRRHPPLRRRGHLQAGLTPHANWRQQTVA